MSVELIEALAQDGLALIDQDVSAVPAFGLAALFKAWQKRKIREAQDILIEELKSGVRLPGEVDYDTFFGLLFRYLNAAKQGAARRNLRLMAQIIRSGCFEDPIPFQPDVVASNADLVSQLSREEIILLATLRRHELDLVGGSNTDDELKQRVHNATLGDLVPRVFDSEEHCKAVVAALGRTGLVVIPDTWNRHIETTPRLKKLCALCDLSVVLDG